MIISRAEFHKRSMGGFNIIEEKDEMMSVERLMKELLADSPFRNHEYMFKKGMDLKKLELQETTVGIKKKFPDIKTEGQRLRKIKKEMIDDTYEAVPVQIDIDYQDVIYVEDGFHRIFVAHQLGYQVIRVKAKYGKFILDKSITFVDLIKLLGMIEGLFGKELKTVKEVKEFLEKVVKKKKQIGAAYSIGYGNYKEYSR